MSTTIVRRFTIVQFVGSPLIIYIHPTTPQPFWRIKCANQTGFNFNDCFALYDNRVLPLFIIILYRENRIIMHII